MSIVTDRVEAMVARLLWEKTGGGPTFGADAAAALASEIHALPPQDRARAWRTLDSFTERSQRMVDAPTGERLLVELAPISRPDAEAAAILAKESEPDLAIDLTPWGIENPQRDQQRLDFSNDPGPASWTRRADVGVARPGPDGNARIVNDGSGWVAVEPMGAPSAPAVDLAPPPPPAAPPVVATQPPAPLTAADLVDTQGRTVTVGALDFLLVGSDRVRVRAAGSDAPWSRSPLRLIRDLPPALSATLRAAARNP